MAAFMKLTKTIKHPSLTLSQLLIIILRQTVCTAGQAVMHACYQQLLVPTRPITHTSGKDDGWDGTEQGWPVTAEDTEYGQDDGK